MLGARSLVEANFRFSYAVADWSAHLRMPEVRHFGEKTQRRRNANKSNASVFNMLAANDLGYAAELSPRIFLSFRQTG